MVARRADGCCGDRGPDASMASRWLGGFGIPEISAASVELETRLAALAVEVPMALVPAEVRG
jgi:hypothetical protein